MKIVMNNPRFGHEHFARAFGGKQLVSPPHDSARRLQSEPDRKGNEDQRRGGDRFAALTTQVLRKSFDWWQVNDVDGHDKIDIHPRENNSCNRCARTLTCKVASTDEKDFPNRR